MHADDGLSPALRRRLDEAIAEYLAAAGSGTPLDREEFVARYSDVAEHLRTFLAAEDAKHDRPQAAESLPATIVTGGSATAAAGPAIPSAGSVSGEAVTIDSGISAPTDGETASSSLAVSGSRVFGDYELLEEVARGGMGVVWKARHVKLNRIVALKMILAGQLAGPDDVQRFYAEAEAAAQLDHPGIVPIYEIGQHEGQHFFAMAYVEGESLAAKVAAGPLPPREAAELASALAGAVHYAHERGVIHRDLKPGNVLLDRSGQPRITDFGLAKRIHMDSSLTATGQILGTPSYMPPEQAAGNTEAIGPAADIYALGAILYTLLTGRPPFQAANVMDTLRQVMEQEPVAPRQLNPSVVVDLDTICLKCLQKDQRRRYASARDLSDDLERYLRGEPIHARPVGRLVASWRWARRHPARAGLFGASAIALLALVALGVGFSYQARLQVANHNLENEKLLLGIAKGELEQANGRLEGALGAETKARVEVAKANKQLLEAKGEIEKANENLNGTNKQLTDANAKLDQANDKLGRIAYADRLMRAQGEFEAGNLLIGQELLDECEPKYRGWEWRHLHLKLHEHELATLNPRDNQASQASAAALFDAREGQHLLAQLRGDWTFSPDSRWQVNTGMRLCDARDGRILAVLQGHTNDVRHVTFSPNGKLLAAASHDGTVCLWDLRVERTDFPYAGPRPELMVLGSDQDERFIFRQEFQGGSVSATLIGVALSRLVVFINDTQVGESKRLDDSPDNVQVVAANVQKFLHQEKNVLTVQVNNRPALPELALKLALKMSDGSIRYVVTDKSWQAAKMTEEGKPGSEWAPARSMVDRSIHQEVFVPKVAPLATLKGHAKHVDHVAFSPDGQRLASASEDGTVRLWDVRDAKPLGVLEAHTGAIDYVTFSPDGRRLASQGRDSTVRLWDASDGKLLRTLPGCSAPVFSPDGRWLAAASSDKTVRLWDARDGKPLATLEGHAGSVSHVGFSPDGQRLASASYDKTVRVWTARDGKLLAILQHTGPVVRVAFSPDGERMASLEDGVTVRLWDLGDGGALATLEGHKGQVWRMTFSPDGRLLASASEDKTVPVWNAHTGKLHATLAGHTESVRHVEFSPNGERLASASNDQTARLWDVREGKLLATLQGHTGPVNHVTFSPNGQLLASAGNDKTARFWDVGEGKLLATLQGHLKAVNHVAFRPDGRQLASASDDGTPRLWDADIAVGPSLADGPPAEWIWGGTAAANDRYVFRKEFEADSVAATLIATCDNRMVVSMNGVKMAESSDFNAPARHDVQKHLRKGKNILSVEAFNEDGPAGLALKLALKMSDGSLRYVVTDKSWQASKLDEKKKPGSEGWSAVVTLGQMGVAPWGDVFTPNVVGVATLVLGHGWGIEYDHVAHLAFSPDGQRLASADRLSVILWDVRDLKRDIHVAQHEKGTGAICSPMLARMEVTNVGVRSFNAAGELVATGDGDGIVRLWDIKNLPTRSLSGGPLVVAPNLKPLATLRGHTGAVHHLAFSSDGKYLASAGQDGTVRLWDVRERKPLATLRGHTGAVTHVAFSPNGKSLASAGADGTVRMWFSEDTPERRAYRSQLWREKQAEQAEAAGEWFAAAFHLNELLNQEPGNKSLEARWDKAIAELAKVDKELAQRAAAKRKKGPKTPPSSEKAKSESN